MGFIFIFVDFPNKLNMPFHYREIWSYTFQVLPHEYRYLQLTNRESSNSAQIVSNSLNDTLSRKHDKNKTSVRFLDIGIIEQVSKLM